MKKILVKYLYNAYAIIGILVVIIIALIILFKGEKASQIEFAEAKMGSIQEIVSITGKISPVYKTELAFEKSGVIKQILFKVGDHINKGELIASLNDSADTANLASAYAQLGELRRNLRPEEYAANIAVVNSASTTLKNAQDNAYTAMRDSYVKSQNALVNYIDSVFTNAQSVNPQISIRTQSQEENNSINNKRLNVTEALRSWKILIDSGKKNDNHYLITKSEEYLDIIKDLISSLTIIVNNLDTGNSGLTQTNIDTYAIAINNAQSVLTQALTTLDTANATLVNAEANYREAYNKFLLEKAGSSAENIAVGMAKVDAAKAELNKDNVFSPINGVVTRIDPNIGEYVAMGQTVFAIQSDDSFKIEANVPEADIAKISINNEAKITLDAYGDTIFPGKVTNIDPAETVIEGVPTYKVTLIFTEPDQRIRSGMTANTEILTRSRDNAIIIPSRAVQNEDGIKSVRILQEDGKNYNIQKVETGLKDVSGLIEIISGVSAGQKVVTYIK